MQRNVRRGEVDAGNRRLPLHEPAPHYITEFTPRFPPPPLSSQKRRSHASSSSTPSSSPSTAAPVSSAPLSSTVPPPTPSSPAVLDRILRLVRLGDHARAITLYQKHLPTLLSASPPTYLTHHDLVHAYRMIGECHRALSAYPQAEAALLSALHHCEEAIALIPPLTPSAHYQALLDLQQVHHLLGDTYVGLSEAAEDSTSACQLALEALELAAKAEDEAVGLLSGNLDPEQDREIKEAVLSAHINVAVVYQRLMTLAAEPPPDPPLAEPLKGPGHYLTLSQKRLRKAYRTAQSFLLHQYQFLCQWHLMQGEVKGGAKAEALVHVREGLEVFERCRADGKSRTLEWQESEWKREEVDLLIEGTSVVWDLQVEGEDETGEEREWRAEAFGWIDRVRRQWKAKEIELDKEKKKRVIRLFNALKAGKGVTDGGRQWAALVEKDSNSGRGQDGSSIQPIKRRKVLDD